MGHTKIFIYFLGLTLEARKEGEMAIIIFPRRFE